MEAWRYQTKVFSSDWENRPNNYDVVAITVSAIDGYVNIGIMGLGSFIDTEFFEWQGLGNLHLRAV